MRRIETTKTPGTIGPYSQAIFGGDLIFVSGQLSPDPETGNMRLDIQEVAEQSLEDIRAALEGAGSGLDKVVKTTIFIANMKDSPLINGVCGSCFTNHEPTRFCVEVMNLSRGANVEVEAITLGQICGIGPLAQEKRN